MNGIHPLCSNEYTLANLDLLDDDFDVDSGVESTVKVTGSARSGSLKSKERRLKGRRNKEGQVEESQAQEEEEVYDDRTVGEDEEGAHPGDQPQAFPKWPSERHVGLPHHLSSEGSKNNNLPLSPTSSSEMVSWTLKLKPQSTNPIENQSWEIKKYVCVYKIQILRACTILPHYL